MTQCHLTPDQIHDLTPWQIHNVYLHPRADDGSIRAPAAHTPAPSDTRARLHQLVGLADLFKLPPETVAELKRRLEAPDRGDPPGAD